MCVLPRLMFSSYAERGVSSEAIVGVQAEFLQQEANAREEKRQRRKQQTATYLDESLLPPGLAAQHVENGFCLLLLRHTKNYSCFFVETSDGSFSDDQDDDQGGIQQGESDEHKTHVVVNSENGSA